MRLAPILSRLVPIYEVDMLIEFSLDKGNGLSTIDTLVTTMICGSGAGRQRIAEVVVFDRTFTRLLQKKGVGPVTAKRSNVLYMLEIGKHDALRHFQESKGPAGVSVSPRSAL
jgi:hypothetical protein